MNIRPILTALSAAAALATGVSQVSVAESPAALPPVDAATVTGTEFVSARFKLHYQLPKGWKALNDAARVAANHQLHEQYAHPAFNATAATVQSRKAPAKSPAKPPSKTPALINAMHPAAAPVVPENFSLMAASIEAPGSLDADVLPRINIWAHHRTATLDAVGDHAHMLAQRAQVILPATAITLGGHVFERVDVLHSRGQYHSQWVTVVGDYLVGFDLRADSDDKLLALVQSMQSVRFD